MAESCVLYGSSRHRASRARSPRRLPVVVGQPKSGNVAASTPRGSVSRGLRRKVARAEPRSRSCAHCERAAASGSVKRAKYQVLGSQAPGLGHQAARCVLVNEPCEVGVTDPSAGYCGLFRCSADKILCNDDQVSCRWRLSVSDYYCLR